MRSAYRVSPGAVSRSMWASALRTAPTSRIRRGELDTRVGLAAVRALYWLADPWDSISEADRADTIRHIDYIVRHRHG